LIAIAEIALLLFAIHPVPWNFVFKQESDGGIILGD